MTERILARLIDLEVMVSVLYQRDDETSRNELRNDPFDERRLAAAGPPGESENAHWCCRPVIRSQRPFPRIVAIRRHEACTWLSLLCLACTLS